MLQESPMGTLARRVRHSAVLVTLLLFAQACTLPGRIEVRPDGPDAGETDASIEAPAGDAASRDASSVE